MSDIGELALLVNNNFEKPLNQQIRENKFLAAEIITTSTNYMPQKNGWYKIICVGEGGIPYYSGNFSSVGGAGGVAIKNIYLEEDMQCNIEINSASDYGDTASISGSGFHLIATGGQNGWNDTVTTISGGIGTGGDFNYTGQNGILYSNIENKEGASVGVYIPGLMHTHRISGGQNYVVVNSGSATSSLEFSEAISGNGICGLGCSAGIYYKGSSGMLISPNGNAGIIIIPLELEE